MASRTETGVTELVTTSDVEAALVRSFAAPRRLVFEAYTNPVHVPQWLLGPPGWTMPVCEIDLRVGGRWRFCWRREDGGTLEMHGVYREIVRPERLVNTETWGADWPETVNTLTLSEVDGVTTLRQAVRYPSREARDAALRTGMRDGAAQSYQRLDALLPTLA